MATTMVRWAAAKQLQTMIQAHATITDDSVVTLTYPGDAAGPDAIWLEATFEGSLDIPVMTGPARDTREDVFTLVYGLRSQGHSTADDAGTRVAVLAAVLEDVLANDPSVNNLDGVIDALIRPTIGPQVFDMASAGFMGFVRITIEIDSRLY